MDRWISGLMDGRIDEKLIYQHIVILVDKTTL